MKTSVAERREDQRLPFELQVTLHVGGGGLSLRGVSRDLSRKGMFVALSQVVSVGQRVDVLVASGEKDETLVIGGRIVHAIPGRGVGIEFTQPSAVSVQRIERILQRKG